MSEAKILNISLLIVTNMGIWSKASVLREIDDLMVGSGTSVLKLMERAGIAIADHISGLDADKIVILAGPGNNGGDALVAARHLHSKGFDVIVFLASDNLKDAPQKNLEKIRHMEIAGGTKELPSAIEDADLIVDGLLGFSLNGAPRGTIKEMIDMVNDNDTPVLSIDVPSGLDSEKGIALHPHIRADMTIALALPKIGTKLCSKRVFVADIGIPKDVYAKVGIDIGDLFAQQKIIELS